MLRYRPAQGGTIRPGCEFDGDSTSPKWLQNLKADGYRAGEPGTCL